MLTMIRMITSEYDVLVTGFVVVSSNLKRNTDFHELFRTIPEGDYLVEGASVRGI